MSTRQRRDCRKLLGYQFSNPELLRQALTHSSDKRASQLDNERLEFLGDSILGMLVCEYLYCSFGSASEGKLTQLKSSLVSRRTLARIARELGLAEYLVVGKGVLKQSALATGEKRIPPSILSNALEALIAAIYLDGGVEPARRFVLRLLRPELEKLTSGKGRRDYKSLLQEFSQRNMQLTPTYRVVDASGPDHDRQFRVVALIGEKEYETGTGNSKKQAEQDAAYKTYQLLARDAQGR